jgi:hypothetical protein
MHTRPRAFVLRPGMPIAQILVAEVDGIPFEKDERQFKGQRSPLGPTP